MDLMTIDEMRQHKWRVSWSGGKDSTATIILMHENDVPIDRIVYVRMMFDDELPATLPVMTDFVDKTIDRLKEWGYEVEVVKSKNLHTEYQSRFTSEVFTRHQMEQNMALVDFAGVLAYSNRKSPKQ